MSGNGWRIPDEMIERARAVDLLEEAARYGVKLKRVGAGEYAGACPRCGGTDRFSINTRKQLWHCRGCGLGGDVIALTQNVEAMTFAEAVETLTGEERKPSKRSPAPAAVVPSRDDGDEAKREAARKLKSAARIVAELVPIIRSPEALRYLAEVRKIDVGAIADVLERVDAIGWHPSAAWRKLIAQPETITSIGMRDWAHVGQPL
jgi:DNA primase